MGIKVTHPVKALPLEVHQVASLGLGPTRSAALAFTLVGLDGNKVSRLMPIDLQSSRSVCRSQRSSNIRIEHFNLKLESKHNILSLILHDYTT